MDTNRLNLLTLSEMGIGAAWTTIQQADEKTLDEACKFAATLAERVASQFGRDVTYDEYCATLDDTALRREYAALLTGSQQAKRRGDVGPWAIFTLGYYAASCEIMRRRMWSQAGRERAQTVATEAAERLAVLAAWPHQRDPEGGWRAAAMTGFGIPLRPVGRGRKDSTAAARQRRYRQKRKAVTPRHS